MRNNNLNTEAFELLRDLALLLKKHGKESFSELATILKDGDMLEQITLVLDNVSQKSPQQKRKKYKRPSRQEERTRFRNSIIKLGAAEPEKSHILLTLFDSLQEKTVLPSLRDLSNFISDNGLFVPKSKTRHQMIFSFIKICTEMPLNELQDILSSISFEEQTDDFEDSDRSLKGWGKIILK